MKNYCLIVLISFCYSVYGGEIAFKKSSSLISLTSNVNPSKGMFGITIGGIQPIIGDGQVFETNVDYPHGDIGAIIGFDYWKKNLNSFDYHLGLNAKYIPYHFHYSPAGADEIKGQFRLLYYSIPFTLHFQIPNYSFLQIIAGVAITSMNLLPVQNGKSGTYDYQTTIDLKWVASPELIAGINFLEEKTDYFIVRGSINYSTFPLRNQSYGVFMRNESETLSIGRKMPASKIELHIVIYPKWKFKSALGKDDAINCPSPF